MCYAIKTFKGVFFFFNWLFQSPIATDHLTVSSDLFIFYIYRYLMSVPFLVFQENPFFLYVLCSCIYENFHFVLFTDTSQSDSIPIQCRLTYTLFLSTDDARGRSYCMCTQTQRVSYFNYRIIF